MQIEVISQSQPVHYYAKGYLSPFEIAPVDKNSSRKRQASQYLYKSRSAVPSSYGNTLVQ